jgi:hypothetical protein
MQFATTSKSGTGNSVLGIESEISAQRLRVRQLLVVDVDDSYKQSHRLRISACMVLLRLMDVDSAFGSSVAVLMGSSFQICLCG